MGASERDAALDGLDRLVGDWAVEATHPMLPGVVVPGRVVFEWLEGQRFLIQRSRAEHDDFPDSISIVGVTDHELTMNYFDSRGVHRVYGLAMTDGVLRIWRDAPGFSQRFEGPLSGDGDLIDGLWQLRQDDGVWRDDLKITYRRQHG